MKTAIVLAGGLGTRLRTVVKDTPKPMALVQGRPFLELLLEYYRAQGISRFILSVGHLAHIIQDHFGNAWKDCAIDYSVETEPLGTGGGILQASTLLKTGDHTCLALNGDTFFAIDVSKLAHFHAQKNAAISLSAFCSSDVERYMGMSINETNRVTSLNVKSQSEQCLVNGGAYVINQSLLRTLNTKPIASQSWENETLPRLLKDGISLYADPISADFIDIGIPTDYERAQHFNFHKRDHLPPTSSNFR